MILLAGLGNQGSKYAQTRHNIGFMAIEEIARQWNAGPFKDKYTGQFITHNVSGQKVGLFKTGVYMNECGHSLSRIASFYKINPTDLIVFHDELDLRPGQIRVKFGGGHAGHNGLRSIDGQFGSQDYWRVRLGIGHPRDLDQSSKNVSGPVSAGSAGADKGSVSSYVLGNFNNSERQWLAHLLKAIGENAEYLVEKELEAFQNRVCMATGKDQ